MRVRGATIGLSAGLVCGMAAMVAGGLLQGIAPSMYNSGADFLTLHASEILALPLTPILLFGATAVAAVGGAIRIRRAYPER